MHEDISEIMSEAPNGYVPSQGIPQGFGVVDTLHTAGDAGMVAHRGVLHPDEYVDSDVLLDAACEAVGFTHTEITTVYRQGLKSPEQRQLRERIDSRMLALRRAGGNMQQLADALGLNEKTLDRALKRARSREVVAVVLRPAVISRLVCFKCGDEGATIRKRRFSQSPDGEVGSVALCSACYTAGFDQRPGNPRYWAHRLATTPIRGSYTPPVKPTQVFPPEYPSDESYAQFVRGSR